MTAPAIDPGVLHASGSPLPGELHWLLLIAAVVAVWALIWIGVVVADTILARALERRTR
ncbi:hypothetical protein [Halomarina pelagica]|uniref:hypothetical protein n=1 Tax=Halomarina pelagica TaxID=2961599 RepID=UPI0020C1E7D1|nr:hypothetical protein [Halomarina sp. BND7]